MGGGVDVEMGGRGLPLFYYFTVQSYLLCLCVYVWGGSEAPFITFQIFICTFLIHYGSVQKKLTALFNFGSNKQKNKWANLFECPGKIFLSIENILKKISVDQP